eukprot:s73_g31.t1
MEIDQVQWRKGKGKTKGKFDPKGKSKGKGKGKYNSPQTKGSKGDGKSFKGKGSGSRVSDDVCNYCGKIGHWKRDCFKYKREKGQGKVRVVEEDGNAQTSTASSSTSHVNNSGNNSKQQQGSVNVFQRSSVLIEEIDESPIHDLTAFDDIDDDGFTFPGSVHVVSHLDDSATFSGEYMPTAAVFCMDNMDSDDDWTVEPCDILCIDLTTPFQQPDFDFDVHSVRALRFAGDPVDIISDSGADGSVLPMSYAHVGTSVLAHQDSSYVDAQGAPIKIHDIRLAEITMSGVRFKEKFLIGNVTTPLLSLGRFFRAGWSICNESDSFCLVKGKEKIDIGFRRNSLVAQGFIRVISDASSDVPVSAEEFPGRRSSAPGNVCGGEQQDVGALRAVVLTERLQSVGRRWEQLGPELWAMMSYGNCFVDTTLIPADQLMWRRTTLLKVNGSHLDSGHTGVFIPEALGFSLEAPHAVLSEPARGSGDVDDGDAAEAAAPADARAELPPDQRVVPVETNEVYVDGVLLSEASSLRALRTGLQFPWAQAVDAERVPAQQHVPGQPAQAEKDVHDLVHIPYRDWCPLCVSFKARQDKHVAVDHTTSSNSLVSFDFGYASRKGDEDTLTVLFAHDRLTGAMIGIPTPAKGGKYMPYLATELARFVVQTGHNPVTLRCDNEPATLSLLDTVRKALRAINIHTNAEPVPPGDHQANGAAEATVKVIRQQAALLLRQLEVGGDVVNCPWDYGYAALGSKLVLAKRILPSLPSGAHARDDDDVEERPAKPQKLTQVSHVRCVIDGAEYTHEDAQNPTYFQDGELDALEEYENTLQSPDEDDAEGLTSIDAAVEQLKYPFTEEEPDVSVEKLAHLDQIADQVELSRLSAMHVILPAENVDCSAHVELSTRFVRTWRIKRDEATGTQYYLRRLTVNQEGPTVVTAVDAAGVQRKFVLGKVLPGQRDGSLLLLWHRDLASFLKDEFNILPFDPYPSLLRNDKCVVIIHVDDVLFTGERSYLVDVVLPAFKKRYKISHELVDTVGSELSFLKRRRVLISKDELFIQPHVKHTTKLFEMLKIKPNVHAKKTPAHPEINEPDDTEALSAEHASVFRTCVGVLPYLSADLVECQFVIRYLAQCMKSPTSRSFAVLRHLCLYLLGCVEHGISLKMKRRGSGLYHAHGDSNVLEVFSDSDWAAHKGDRKSVSSVAVFYRGCLIYSASRSQKVISLSSAEAELHSAVSAVCDSILISLSGEELQTVLYIDNSAARQILQRQGVGRIRHLSVKTLWLQTRVRDGLIAVKGIESSKNVADVGTKRLGQAVEKVSFVWQPYAACSWMVETPWALASNCDAHGAICSAEQHSEVTDGHTLFTGMVGWLWALVYFACFLPLLAVGRAIYVCHLNRRFRAMRDQFGDVGLGETDDPEGWMEFHHGHGVPRGEPIVLEEPEPEESNRMMLEESEEATMDEAGSDPPTSETNVDPTRVLSARVDRRIQRGVYTSDGISGRKQALASLLMDCMVHQSPAEQGILLETVAGLEDLTDDEHSPVHALAPGQVEIELRQAHQAMQVGAVLFRAAAAARSTGSNLANSGSVVVDAIADSLISDGPEEADNAVARYMRELNNPNNMR